jgi:AcrR family transcriptional regulator
LIIRDDHPVYKKKGSMARAARSDALRNRELVLEAARELFAERGLAVTVLDIAQHAGVGVGTVGRHFPTKQSLMEAVFVSRVDWLIERAAELSGEDPTDAFLELFGLVVDEGLANRGLAEALAGAGFDLAEATSGPDRDIMERLGDLLVAAQRDGRIRGDITRTDVKVLVTMCANADRAASPRLLDVVTAGLIA